MPNYKVRPPHEHTYETLVWDGINPQTIWDEMSVSHVPTQGPYAQNINCYWEIVENNGLKFVMDWDQPENEYDEARHVHVEWIYPLGFRFIRTMPYIHHSGVPVPAGSWQEITEQQFIDGYVEIPE